MSGDSGETGGCSSTDPPDDRDPVIDVGQVLKKWDVSRNKLTHCMMSLGDNDETNSVCATSCKVNRFCWVDVISESDSGGSIPDTIKKVLYLLHMTQKYHETVRFGGANSDSSFIIERAEPYDAYTLYQQRACFHKVICNGTIETMPLFNIKIYIEPAYIVEETNVRRFFVFLVVECPITLDLPDLIENACNGSKSKSKGDFDVKEGMKEMWKDIAYKQRHFCGGANLKKRSMLQVVFSDIFDPDSEYCCWKLFRVANCIRDARIFMELWYLSQPFCQDKSVRRRVRFAKIDSSILGYGSPEYLDEIWCQLSNCAVSANFSALCQYQQEMAIYNARKKSKKRRLDVDEQEGGFDDANEELEAVLPVFRPYAIFSHPTHIDVDNTATGNLIASLSVRADNLDIADISTRLTEHMSANADKIVMGSFPETLFTIQVNHTMLMPRGNFLVPYTEWLQTNRSCDPPYDIKMLICCSVMNPNFLGSVVPESSILADYSLPRSILTASDLRALLSENPLPDQYSMLYNRSARFYQACEIGFKKPSNGTERAYAFSGYVRDTAISIANATAKNDNGANGGQDPRVCIYNDFGNYIRVSPQNKEYECYMMCLFWLVVKPLLQKLEKDDNEVLSKTRGSILYGLFLYNEIMIDINQNYNLKGNNLQLITRLLESDIGLNISYYDGNIGMAKNGIGLTNHVVDFNRCLHRIKQNGTLETNKEKEWGTGVDTAMGVYLSMSHPSNNKCPQEISLSGFPEVKPLVGSSAQGLWKRYSETIKRDGERLNVVDCRPPHVYATELPVSDGKSGDGALSFYGMLTMLVRRNTEMSCGSQRTTSVKNERTGKIESATEICVCDMTLMLYCHNDPCQDTKAITLQAITMPIPSAAVDIDDTDYNMHVGHEQRQAENDMGDRNKHCGRRDDATDIPAHPFYFCVQGLAQVVVNIQRIGMLGKFADGYEGGIMKNMANCVYLNQAWMTPETGNAAARGRQIEMVQSRIPPMGLLLHCTQVFLSPNASLMSWQDMVHTASMNWAANPCPSVLIPHFLSTLVQNTFDWSIWLLLFIFVDHFKVPYLSLEDAESIFSSKAGVRGCANDNIVQWLTNVGFDNSDDKHGNHDIVFQPPAQPLMARSGVYVTSHWDSDMTDLSNSPLVAIIEKQGTNAKNPNTSSTKWKLAETIGNNMWEKYQTKLRSACNITNASILVTMLYRHLDKPLHFPKMGAVPCGLGFESLDGVLKGLGSEVLASDINNKPDSDCYVDGDNDCIKDLLRESGRTYSISPFCSNNKDGSVWCFGVEVRFLLLGKALLGNRTPVSQMSVQSVLDTMCMWTIRDRIPSTIFSESSCISVVPASGDRGLNIQNIPLDCHRPLTMTRPNAALAVESGAKALLPAVVNGKMPEDYFVVGHIERLCKLLSDESVSVHPYDIHMELLHTPSIPKASWVPVHIVHKNEPAHMDTFTGYAAEYSKGALYRRLDGSHTILVTSKQNNCVETDLVPSAIVPSGSATFGHGDLHDAECTHILLRQQCDDIFELTASSEKTYVRYLPTFCRQGILVLLPGFKSYCTIIPWQDTHLRYSSLIFADAQHHYFNPYTMGYLAVCDALPISAFYNISNHLLQQSIVPVGTIVYIDILHPAVPANITRNLLFKRVLSQEAPAELRSTDNHNLSEKKYHEKFESYSIVVVVHAMLTYTLPKCVVSNGTTDVPNCISVCVTQKVSTGTQSHHVCTNILVPTAALITPSRYDQTQTTLVEFSSYTT